MAELRDLLVKHIEDAKKAKKSLEAKVKELQGLQDDIKQLDADIKLSEKYLSESKSGRRGRPRKQQKRGSRIDRSQLRNDVLSTIRNAGSAGIARGDLIATVGIKGDKRAEGYLGNYLSELQKNGTVGRGPAEEGKAYGPYVHSDHMSSSSESSSGFSSSSF